MPLCEELLANTLLMNLRILYSVSVMVQGSAKKNTYKVHKIKLKSESWCLDTLSYGNKFCGVYYKIILEVNKREQQGLQRNVTGITCSFTPRIPNKKGLDL